MANANPTDTMQIMKGIEELKDETRKLTNLVNGNRDADIPGIRPRLTALEDKLASYPTAKAFEDQFNLMRELNTKITKYENRAWGIWAVLTAMGVTTGGLAWMVVQLTQGVR